LKPYNPHLRKSAKDGHPIVIGKSNVAWDAHAVPPYMPIETECKLGVS